MMFRPFLRQLAGITDEIWDSDAAAQWNLLQCS